MIYTIKHSDWQWLIEPNGKGRKYVLKYKKPRQWRACGKFKSPETAAQAVADGKTGVKGWDGLKHEKPFPALSAWLIDPTGVVLKAATRLLRAALPDLPDSGRGFPASGR
ncbi:MAG TPA: hypothetical protein VGG34_01100 [Opitutaceae bacterium]